MSKIFEVIPKIMAEVGFISKDRKNVIQNYRFRGIDDVYFAMQPVLSKHGVFYTSEVVENLREERQTKAGGNLLYSILKMKFTFYADDGSNISCVTVGEAMDSSDKASNKAMSSALKYALLQLFCIPTDEPKDVENDHHVPEPRSAQNEAPPLSNALLVVCPFKKYQGKSVGQIPIFELDDYIKYVIRYSEEQNKPFDQDQKDFVNASLDRLDAELPRDVK